MIALEEPGEGQIVTLRRAGATPGTNGRGANGLAKLLVRIRHTEKMMKNIAIIGAGLSGLMLAERLSQRAVACTVFEKSRGSGGRMTTRRKPWGHIDLGAQYFTARSPAFKAQVDSWEKAGFVRPWNFTPYKVTKNGLLMSPDDVIPSPKTGISASTARYVATPDMSSLAHSLACTKRVFLQTPIQKVIWHNPGWSLLSEDGQHYEDFDALVLALPAEQGKTLLAEFSVIHEAIPELVHSPCWALALATKGTVDPAIQGIFGDDMISWVSRQSAKPERKIMGSYDDLWVLHFSPAWSSDHGRDQADCIPAIGKAWLQSILAGELAVVHSDTHYWRYANIQENISTSAFYLDRDKNLAVIGAWCCGGKIEGAFESAAALVNSDWIN